MKRQGFTLLELVIVLGILSVLTMLASRGITNRQHELRADKADALLADVEAAIVGDRFAKDTERASFVGDMGRLPRAVTNSLDETQLTLGELFVKPARAVVFGVYPAKGNLCSGAGLRSLPMDDGVMVPMGWRGPYLRLGPGVTEPFVRDPWGSPMVSWNARGAATNAEDRLMGETWDGLTEPVATNGMPIAFIRHLGANGLSGLTEGEETGYDKDVVIAPVSNAFVTAVNGYVEMPEAAVSLVVRAYGPPPNPASEADAKRVMAWEWRRSGVWTEGDRVPFAMTNLSERMTTGLRMIRACAVTGGAVTNFSVPMPVVLTPGANVLTAVLKIDRKAP